MYLVFTRMLGESYRGRHWPLMYWCCVFRALINSLVCCLCTYIGKWHYVCQLQCPRLWGSAYCRYRGLLNQLTRELINVQNTQHKYNKDLSRLILHEVFWACPACLSEYNLAYFNHCQERCMSPICLPGSYIFCFLQYPSNREWRVVLTVGQTSASEWISFALPYLVENYALDTID